MMCIILMDHRQQYKITAVDNYVNINADKVTTLRKRFAFMTLPLPGLQELAFQNIQMENSLEHKTNKPNRIK